MTSVSTVDHLIVVLGCCGDTEISHVVMGLVHELSFYMSLFAQILQIVSVQNMTHWISSQFGTSLKTTDTSDSSNS